MLLNTISGMDLKAISSICCAGRRLVPGLESENRRVLLSASLCEKNLVTGVFAFKCQTEFQVAGFFPVFSFLWTLSILLFVLPVLMEIRMAAELFWKIYFPDIREQGFHVPVKSSCVDSYRIEESLLPDCRPWRDPEPGQILGNAQKRNLKTVISTDIRNDGRWSSNESLKSSDLPQLYGAGHDHDKDLRHQVWSLCGRNRDHGRFLPQSGLMNIFSSELKLSS